MGQWLTYSITTVDESDLSVRLRLRIIYNSSLGVNDTTNELDVTGGDWPSLTNFSQTIYVPSGGGTDTIYDEEVQFFKNYGASYVVDFAASLTGINYWGSSAVISTSGSKTVAARPYDPPAAPTNVSAARNSDTSHALTWTRNATTAAPYGSQEVYRWSVTSQTWVKIATLPSTTTAWTDNGTVANNAYKWKIKAINSSGSALSAESDGGTARYTTATAPNPITATKENDNSITIAWTPTWPYTGYVVEVQRQSIDDAQSWTTLSSTLPSGTTSYNDPSPNPAQQHRYRARAIATGTIYGTLGYTAWVQLTAPPNAPTNLSGDLLTFDEATDQAVQTWQHNPVDSSAQRKRQIRVRRLGDVTWVEQTAVTTVAQSITRLPGDFSAIAGAGLANGESVEWQVRTWGAATTGGADGTGASAWSATHTLKLSAHPTATISDPVDLSTITTSSTGVTWAYYDAESTTQAAWRAKLYQGANLKESKNGSDAATSTTFASKLANATTYTITVEVQDADGLWSVADSVTFDTDFLPPEDALVDLEFDPSGAAVSITVSPQGYVGGVSVAATSFTVERSLDGGETWETYLEDVPINGAPTTVTDYAPTLGGINTYRVTMASATPSSAVTADSPQDIDTTGLATAMWLSAGPGFSLGCNARANVRESAAANRVRARQHYAGRPRPVAHVALNTNQTWAVNADLIGPTADPGASTPEEWLALGLEDGPFLLRTPSGLYEVVDLAGSGINVARDAGGARHALSFIVEATDG